MHDPRSELRAARLRDVYLPVVGAKTAPIYAHLECFADSNATILLRGPTGIGKTRLARWVHERSRRRGRPFVDADLQSLPSELVAGALFGHRRGAYTSASESRKGRIQDAEHGTLFLDEIDKLGLAEQALLLRVLEQGAYRELGGDAHQADVRFLVGTNANLEKLVKQGRFRQDLYFRINAVPIHLPALEERRDEIGPWAIFLMEEINRGEAVDEVPPVTLSPAAVALLETRPWPGGLRQLRAILERAWLLARADEGLEISVEENHVLTAILLDHPDQLAQVPDLERDLLRNLERSAELGAQLVLARAQRGGPALPLALWEGFSGMVLEAVRRSRPLDRSSTVLFGLDRQIAGSNYKRTYQRSLARGLELLDALVRGEQ